MDSRELNREADETPPVCAEWLLDTVTLLSSPVTELLSVINLPLSARLLCDGY